MGGPVLVEVPEPGGTHLAGQGLRKVDPACYGSLDHPGDGYAFDIFTQVARDAPLPAASRSAARSRNG